MSLKLEQVLAGLTGTQVRQKTIHRLDVLAMPMMRHDLGCHLVLNTPDVLPRSQLPGMGQ